MQNEHSRRDWGWVTSLQLPEPSFQDNTADADRLRRDLSSEGEERPLSMDVQLVRELPHLLRKSGYRISCCLFADSRLRVVTGVGEPGETWLGLAVDLGTTKYELCLLELGSGRELARGAFDNPQTKTGTDILTRIHYVGEDADRLKEMQDMILEDIRSRSRELCQEANVPPERIANVSVAGNTAMTHFFLRLPPKWVIREPYIPALNNPDLIPCADLGLNFAPRGRVFCFPSAGSYFGGDLFAGIVHTGMHKSEDISILVDVGTNAEVVLGTKDWLIACAGAAGPALEEGMSEIGRKAGPGIIDKVVFDRSKGEFFLQTIDDLPPHGICGSGIIDLAAQLFFAGLLDFRGKFQPERMPEKFKQINEIWHLILVPGERSATGEDLLIGQPEIDSLLRSKAAMFTILETITASVGIELQDISRFYVAGTFGSYIDPESAIGIGMLPDLPRDRFQAVDNSSLGGAVRALQQPETVDEVNQVAAMVTYLELNVNQEFMNKFSAAKFLPHTDVSRFPSLECHQLESADRGEG